MKPVPGMLTAVVHKGKREETRKAQQRLYEMMTRLRKASDEEIEEVYRAYKKALSAAQVLEEEDGCVQKMGAQ
jgi:hypothetical protein